MFGGHSEVEVACSGTASSTKGNSPDRCYVTEAWASNKGRLPRDTADEVVIHINSLAISSGTLVALFSRSSHHPFTTHAQENV